MPGQFIFEPISIFLSIQLKTLGHSTVAAIATERTQHSVRKSAERFAGLHLMSISQAAFDGQTTPSEKLHYLALHVNLILTDGTAFPSFITLFLSSKSALLLASQIFWLEVEMSQHMC